MQCVAPRFDNEVVTIERNKATVVAFYDLMFNRSQPAEAVRLSVGETYTQHNPEMPDGKQAFIAFFEKMAMGYPLREAQFKRVFAAGSFVTLQGETRDVETRFRKFPENPPMTSRTRILPFIEAWQNSPRSDA